MMMGQYQVAAILTYTQEETTNMTTNRFIPGYVKGKNNKSRASTGIPHFLSPNSVPIYPITEEYARYILMVYKPWTNSFKASIKEKMKLRNTKLLLNLNSVLIWSRLQITTLQMPTTTTMVT